MPDLSHREQSTTDSFAIAPLERIPQSIDTGTEFIETMAQGVSARIVAHICAIIVPDELRQLVISFEYRLKWLRSLRERMENMNIYYKEATYQDGKKGVYVLPLDDVTKPAERTIQLAIDTHRVYRRVALKALGEDTVQEEREARYHRERG